MVRYSHDEMNETPRLGRLAAACIVVLFLYYEIYRWVPLGRWNAQLSFPVSNDQFYPDILIGALLFWFAWSFAFARRIGMSTAAVLSGP